MMAFNDTFFVLAALMAISGLMVLFMKRSQVTADRAGRARPWRSEKRQATAVL